MYVCMYVCVSNRVGGCGLGVVNSYIKAFLCPHQRKHGVAALLYRCGGTHGIGYDKPHLLLTAPKLAPFTHH